MEGRGGVWEMAEKTLIFTNVFARSTKEGETYRRLLGRNLCKGKLCFSSTKKTLKPCCYGLRGGVENIGDAYV